MKNGIKAKNTRSITSPIGPRLEVQSSMGGSSRMRDQVNPGRMLGEQTRVAR